MKIFVKLQNCPFYLQHHQQGRPPHQHHHDLTWVSRGPPGMLSSPGKVEELVLRGGADHHLMNREDEVSNPLYSEYSIMKYRFFKNVNIDCNCEWTYECQLNSCQLWIANGQFSIVIWMSIVTILKLSSCKFSVLNCNLYAIGDYCQVIVSCQLHILTSPPHSQGLPHWSPQYSPTSLGTCTGKQGMNV